MPKLFSYPVGPAQRAELFVERGPDAPLHTAVNQTAISTSTSALDHGWMPGDKTRVGMKQGDLDQAAGPFLVGRMTYPEK
jgi:hypothetical protein